MKNVHEKKIIAYVRREMNPAERTAFEAEMAADPELYAETRSQQLTEKAIEMDVEHRLREIAREVRLRVGPLPRPQIGLLDHIRFFFYSRAARGISLALLSVGTLLCAFLLLRSDQCPLSNITTDFYVPPKEVHAIAAVVVDYNQAEKASLFYATGRIDSLELMMEQAVEPSVPTYYAAHLYLKNGDFPRAKEAFTSVLELRENLRAYPEFRDFGRIKYNLLLSRLAETKNRKEALEALRELNEDPDVQGNDVRVRIDKLEKALSNPLTPVWCGSN